MTFLLWSGLISCLEWRSELIKGPFYYGVAVVVTTVGFWRTSPIGIVALINLCAGDGMHKSLLIYARILVNCDIIHFILGCFLSP